MFCKNCGKELENDSKFCNFCGTSVSGINTERKMFYDGDIHKCPNCGEVLKSFSMNCPACGYELRNTNASSAIREFSLKLEKIESNRESEKRRGLFSMAEEMQTISKTDEQKISLIKSFAIPNSKEDMLEFMILATSSVNMRVYDSANTTPVSKSEKAVSEAWYAKVQQVYEKARRSYSNDNIFGEIKELYEKCQRDIEKAKKKNILKWVLLVGWIPLLWIVIIVGLISSPRAEDKEIKRLENIVVKVQETLDKEEYKHALRIADTIDYQRYDKEEERKWDLERDYWVEKVIEEAKENGITLEYTYTENIDNANDKSSDDSSSGGFVEGFKDGLHSNDEEIQENIDKFKENLNGGNSNNKDENETTNNSNTSASFDDNIVATSNKYIKIKEVGYTMVGDYLTCIVTITNTDSKKAIEFPSFRVTAYDKNGKILGSEERVLNVLYPNQSMVDQGTLIEVSEKPHKVEVTIIEPDEDDIVSVSSLEHPEYKEMKCQNLSVNSDKITGEVYNPNNYKIESAMITIVFRDSNNKIISSECVFVDDIPANGKIPFDISLASDAKTTGKIEAFAYLW